MTLIKKQFDKKQVMDQLMDISVSPYKNTFIEKFVEISEAWFSYQFETINHVLPNEIEGYEFTFLTQSDIRMLVGNGHFDDNASIKNIIAQLNNLIHETGVKYLKTNAILSHFNSETGIISFTYVQ